MVQPSHGQLLLVVQDMVEGAEDHSTSTSLGKVLRVVSKRIDPLVTYEGKEHIVILLFNRVVQRSQSSLVPHVEVEHSPAMLLVKQSHVSQCLMLLLPEGQMNRSGRHPIDEIEVYCDLHALLQDLEGGDGVFIVFYKEQVDYVGTHGVEDVGVDLVFERQHVESDVELVGENGHVKRVAVLEALQVQVESFEVWRAEQDLRVVRARLAKRSEEWRLVMRVRDVQVVVVIH